MGTAPASSTVTTVSDPDVVSQNREYWDRLAPHRHGEPVAFFLDGGSALTPDEIAAVGDVQNRRVLQLACSAGDEALTFAQHGATVTAVDLAPAHLATGRAKAKALGLDVTFIEQDLMTLDAQVTGFDAVSCATSEAPEPSRGCSRLTTDGRRRETCRSTSAAARSSPRRGIARSADRRRVAP